MKIADSHEWLMWQAQHGGAAKLLVAALMRHEDVGAVEHELGYTMQELRRHLERQFMDGMSWDNHASLLPRNQLRNAWAIDHIVPKSAFGDHECRAAFRLSNLRPLWWKENMRKAALRTHLL